MPRRHPQPFWREFTSCWYVQVGKKQIRLCPEKDARWLCFVDAAHVVHEAYLGYLWCFVRLLIRGPSGRKRFNVLGPIDAVTSELTSVCNDTGINTESVCELPRAPAGRYVGLPLMLILDIARYQRCAVVQQLAKELRIELLFLTL